MATQTPPAVLARLAADHGTPSIQAEVTRVEKISDGKDEHFKFVVKVSSTSDGYNGFHVRRRYKQFETLHTSLSSKYRGLPALPGKSGLLSMGSDSTQVAEGRREGLTVYLRTLLADPAVCKADDLVSFLEVSAAGELFARLHEKDTQFTFNLAAKDEEIEKMRINLQAANSERSSARAALARAQEDLEESQSRAEALAAKLGAAEETCRRAEAEVAETSSSLEEVRERYEGAQQQVAVLEQSKSALTADLAALEKRAGEAATAAAAELAQAKTDAAAAEGDFWRANKASEAAAAKAADEAAEARAELAEARAEVADARLIVDEAKADCERAVRAAEEATEARASAEETAFKCTEETAAATAATAAAEAALLDAEARARAAEEARASASAAAGVAEAAAERGVTLAARVEELGALLASEKAGRREEGAATEARDAALQSELATARDERRALQAAAASAEAAAATAAATHAARSGEAGEAEAAMSRALAALEGERDHWHTSHDALLSEVKALREESERTRRDASAETQSLASRLEDAQSRLTAAERQAAESAQLAQVETERAERAERLSQVQTPATPDESNARGGFGGHVPRSGASSPPLPSPAQALDALSVAIPSVTRQSGESHWSYCVAVGCGGVSYRVLKRFSDFHTTHKRLLDSGVAARWMGAFPPLPPKRGWSTQDERFAERRRGELQAYLAALVSEPETRGCAELQAFLELGLLLRRG